MDYNCLLPDTPKAYINKNTSFDRKATRSYLLKKKPNCAYCGKAVVLFENNGGTLPDNFATLDHFFSKYTDKYLDEENFVVLCCYKCNQDKQTQEQRKNSPKLV